MRRNISEQVSKVPRHEAWLRRNRKWFPDSRLPTASMREQMFLLITKAGLQVAIVTPQGNVLRGRSVMRGPHGWVLNLGGPHGTPGIASPSNTVWVEGVSNL